MWEADRIMAIGGESIREMSDIHRLQNFHPLNRRYVRVWFAQLLALGLTVPACFAQRTASDSAPAATAPAQSEVPIRANNIVQLRKRLGETVSVIGRVERASESNNGHNFLNFESSELSVVCFKDDVTNFTEGAPAKLYRDKNVVVTGKLEEYRGKLQIVIKTPDQIGLAEQPSSGATLPRAKLKEIGKNSWISPAGLRYAGRDPMGLNRVEHILRHAADVPDRPGSHGVFEAEEEEIFGLIDAAWQKAAKDKIKAVREGDRSTLTVPMGYRVGYLGGQAGRQRKNPALTRIFIVYETGTKNIVTAFPK
jgi:hypothetical protein